MKIVTWNVNSVRVREARLFRFLKARQPDVVCLQELKLVDEKFPSKQLEDIGYHSAVFGQPTYNGVAILSKKPIENVSRGFGDGVDDPQARFIAATIDGVRVASMYVPNGQDMKSDKYPYKKRWLERFLAYLDSHQRPTDAMVLCGDFNIAPSDRDVSHPSRWEGTVLFNPEVRELLERIKAWGFTDLFRMHNDETEVYSWWDYRRVAFDRNEGMLIDFVLGTGSVADCCVAGFIDVDERVEVPDSKPSDHAPVVISIDWARQAQGTLAL